MAFLTFNSGSLPQSLSRALKILSEEYPLRDSTGTPDLIYEPGNSGLSLRHEGGGTVISYRTLAEALRGTALALSGQESCSDRQLFSRLGCMLDCSRNGVIRPESWKRWLRRLALMGYTYAMLYTEDTLLVPEEPSYGYLRGAYSLKDLQELDSYAADLGIEMIPCIQTLGHMEQVIKWDSSLGGTATTLRTGSERVYQMIDNVLKFCRQAFRSRKIHIGMDEAWGETGNEFKDAFRDYKFDIFRRHLARVNELCISNGYPSPMIWSDAFFDFTNSEHFYYSDEFNPIPGLQESIPANVTLVYWDYYHEKTDWYRMMIQRHRSLGFSPAVASSVRTTRTFWYDHDLTARTLAPCVEAARAEHTEDFLLTLWGDDGAFCDFDSGLAGLAYAADLAWGGNGSAARLSPFFRTVCQADYQAVIDASAMQLYIDPKLEAQSPYLLWDDPLNGIMWRKYEMDHPGFWDEAEASLSRTLARLEPRRQEKNAGNIHHACNLVQLLILKIQFRRDLLRAWKEGHPEALLERAEQQMPAAIQAVADSFREQWRFRNRAEGLATMQFRFAGMKERYLETARLIREYTGGDLEALQILDETRAPMPLCYFFHRVNMPDYLRY